MRVDSAGLRGPVVPQYQVLYGSWKELPARRKDSLIALELKTRYSPRMQVLRSAVVPLLFLSCGWIWAAAPKVHTVALGPARRVPLAGNPEKTLEIRIRPLVVDNKLKEWTEGDIHDVTDRSFVVRRVLHVNDTLPGEKVSWVWQPGPWLLVDRISGRITPLHLSNFDATLSHVAWYRDYAAYCGVKTTVRAGGLTAEVWQIGARRAAVEKVLAKWPQPDSPTSPCALPLWKRGDSTHPMEVSLQLVGAQPVSFQVLGTSSLLVEDGSSDEDP